MLFTILLFINVVLSTVIPGSKFQLSFLEQSYLQDDPAVTHKVVFTIKQGDNILGDLTLALFGETCPETVDNFYQLSAMNYGYGYKDCQFHRIIKGFMIQGGNYDGQGGKSIYGKSFNDENFILKHNKLGRLSMANAGKNTNGAQFFILNVQETPHLDGKHVVFGQLVDGFDTLGKISAVEVADSTPLVPVVISDIKTAVKSDSASSEQSTTEEKVEAPVEVEEVAQGPSSVYRYLFIFLLLGVVGLAYKKWSNPKAPITTIRD